MGDPVTAAIAIGASGVMTARGQIASGKAIQNANNFNAFVDERNADIADQNKVLSGINTGLQKKAFSKEFGRAMPSTQQAFRYNGVVASTGTPAMIAMQMAQDADDEVALIEYEGRLRQQGFEEEAVELRAGARARRAEGAAAAKAGRQAAYGSLLKTAATIGQMDFPGSKTETTTQTTGGSTFGGVGGYGAGRP